MLIPDFHCEFYKSTQPHGKVSRPDHRAPRGQKNWQMSLHATASDVAIIIIIIIIIIIGSAERQKRRRATRGNDFSNFGSEKCSKRVISDGNDRKMRGERGESANPLKSQLSTVGGWEGGARLSLSLVRTTGQSVTSVRVSIQRVALF